MTATAHSDFVSPEEYLEMEALAETKHEYIDGQIYAMSPGVSDAHNRIMLNVVHTLMSRFKGRACRAWSSDMRAKVSRSRYFYPDAMALCGTPNFEKYKGVDMLTNPAVIFEVLSPTTTNYDLGAKFTIYREIESLQQYVCAWQAEKRVVNHMRQNRSWIVSDITDTLALPSLDCTLTLDEIYENVEISPEQPGVP